MAKIQKGKNVQYHPRGKIDWHFPVQDKNKKILELFNAIQK